MQNEFNNKLIIRSQENIIKYICFESCAIKDIFALVNPFSFSNGAYEKLDSPKLPDNLSPERLSSHRKR